MAPILEDQYLVKPMPNESTRGYRMEIDEFVEDNELTNLFLIALSNLQKNSLEPIKDAQGKDIPNWVNFYAAAGMDTFPIWHRPYMAFYEGIIYKEMEKVADQYSTEGDRAIYGAAAARFRLPFWDIVMPRNKPGAGEFDEIWGLPSILAAKEVFVKLPQPTGAAKDGFDVIKNPLYSFDFPSVDQRQEANEKLGRPILDVEKLPAYRGQKPPGPWSDLRTTRVPAKGKKNETNDGYANLAVRRQASAMASAVLQLLSPEYKAHVVRWSKADREWVPDPSKTSELDVNVQRTWRDFAQHGDNKGNTGAVLGKDGLYYNNLSVESFHDSIHVLLGTGSGALDNDPGLDDTRAAGHLATPTIAAFDPLFWLHHNNIERLFCLHQAIYPSKYLDEGVSPPLIPFLHENGQGKHWNAGDDWIKEYWHSGFAVPGVEKPKADFAAIKRNLVKYLAETYLWAANWSSTNAKPEVIPKGWPRNLEGSWALQGSSAKPTAHAVVHLSALSVETAQLVHRTVTLDTLADDVPATADQTPAAEIVDEPVRSSEVFELTQAVVQSLPEGALENTAVEEPTLQFNWDAHVKVRKYAFDGSFSVHVFAGWIKPDQPERYMTKKNEAGFTGVFARSSNAIASCANCERQQQDDVYITDIIPLTTFLYEYLDSIPREHPLIRDAQIKTIKNLTPEEVVPFLKENIKFVMIDATANVLTGEQEAGLEILVTHRTYTAPNEQNLLGVFGSYIPHPEITDDKPGGYGYVYTAAPAATT